MMKLYLINDWDSILDSFPDAKKDVYFTYKYCSLYENEENKALCIICSEDENTMLMPFIRGEINHYYDFETSYGYGGPIANTDNAEWCQMAYKGIHKFLKKQNYICGFTRFHPLVRNAEWLIEDSDSVSNTIRVLYDRQTISIDTSVCEEDIWSKQITSKNRNMIRKAEKNHLKYKAEYDFASYDEFIHLYTDTMKRLSADDFYFFDKVYFDRLKENLKGNSFLGTVRKDGKLICAAIFMYSKLYGHYHLEGSNHDFSGFGANNLLLWKTACEMHKLGVKKFHLGGGTSSSPDDSLYKFKKAFSSNEKQFYIGKEIINSEIYNEFCNKWESENPKKVAIYGNRLLKYRY